MDAAADRRIWALYKLQWPVRRIAAETGMPLDDVQDVVTRLRQSPAYALKLEKDPPPPGWEMFPPRPGDIPLPGPETGRYEARHAAPHRFTPAGAAAACVAVAAALGMIAFILNVVL